MKLSYHFIINDYLSLPGGVRAAGCIYSRLFNNPGRVSLDLMHATDWLPTLLTLVSKGKFSNYTKLDGKNLWDTFLHETPSPRKEVLINIDPNIYKNAAIRIGDWKLVSQRKYAVFMSRV